MNGLINLLPNHRERARGGTSASEDERRRRPSVAAPPSGRCTHMRSSRRVSAPSAARRRRPAPARRAARADRCSPPACPASRAQHRPGTTPGRQGRARSGRAGRHLRARLGLRPGHHRPGHGAHRGRRTSGWPPSRPTCPVPTSRRATRARQQPRLPPQRSDPGGHAHGLRVASSTTRRTRRPCCAARRSRFDYDPYRRDRRARPRRRATSPRPAGRSTRTTRPSARGHHRSIDGKPIATSTANQPYPDLSARAAQGRRRPRLHADASRSARARTRSASRRPTSASAPTTRAA